MLSPIWELSLTINSVIWVAQAVLREGTVWIVQKWFESVGSTLVAL
jgi:hypothetical protein